MAFFKPSADAASNKSVARLHALIWVLIYGGLLIVLLGLSVQRTSDPIGWPMVLVGALLLGLGIGLIYVRSRMKTEP